MHLGFISQSIHCTHDACMARCTGTNHQPLVLRDFHVTKKMHSNSSAKEVLSFWLEDKTVNINHHDHLHPYHYFHCHYCYAVTVTYNVLWFQKDAHSGFAVPHHRQTDSRFYYQVQANPSYPVLYIRAMSQVVFCVIAFRQFDFISL